MRWIAVLGVSCGGAGEHLAAQLFELVRASPRTPAPGALEQAVLDAVIPSTGERVIPVVTRQPVALAFDILDQIDERTAGDSWDQATNDPVAQVVATRRSPGAAMVRSGEIWTIDWRGERVELPSTKGLVDRSILIERQGREVHAMELMGGVVDQAGVDDSIDVAARERYESRLGELQAEQNEAEDFNDIARVQRAQTEFDQIVDQLTGAFGLSGRRRTAGSSGDKARSAVTWRIRAAIKKIDRHLPGLGRHLGAAVKTGAWCIYDPEEPVDWRVR